MATLSSFVQKSIPVSLRQGRDFAGPRGWIDLTNQLLKRVARRGLFDLDRKKEIGVEVSNHYWITLPTDFREVVAIHYPVMNEYSAMGEIAYSNDIVNGKIKIDRAFDKEAAPSNFTLSGGTTGLIIANDDDATANQYEGWLLVPTNGTYRTPILLGTHSASAGGSVTLNFLHTQDAAIDSTAGYITSQFLILEYLARYTVISASSQEIPMFDEYEDILTLGLCMMATPLTDKASYDYYRNLFESMIGEAEREVFTPTEDQARPRPRPMAGLDGAWDFDTRSLPVA
jgi:hypothetical protein